MKHLFIIICLLAHQLVYAQNTAIKCNEMGGLTIFIDTITMTEPDERIYRYKSKDGILENGICVTFYKNKPLTVALGSMEYPGAKSCRISFKKQMYGLKTVLNDLALEYPLDKVYQMWIAPLSAFWDEVVDINIEYNRLRPQNKKFDSALFRKLYEKKLINAIRDTLLLYDLDVYDFNYEKVAKISRNFYKEFYQEKGNRRKLPPPIIMYPGNILLQIRPLKNE